MIGLSQSSDKSFTAHATFGHGSGKTPLEAMLDLRRKLAEGLAECDREIIDEKLRQTGPGPGRE